MVFYDAKLMEHNIMGRGILKRKRRGNYSFFAV